ncbi:MAG: hypothetical protein ACTSRU_12560 [Candidatus Hodarchaeales archaeon]
MGNQLQIPSHIGNSDDPMWEWVIENIEDVLAGLIVSARKSFNDGSLETNVEIFVSHSRIHTNLEAFGYGIGYSWALIKTADGKCDVGDFALEYNTLEEGGELDAEVERMCANV